MFDLILSCYTGCGVIAEYRHHIVEDNEDLLACRQHARDLIDDEETVDQAIARSPAAAPCREHESFSQLTF